MEDNKNKILQDEEFYILEPEDIQKPKEHELPIISESEHMSFDKGSEKRNYYKMKKMLSLKILPEVIEMHQKSDKMLFLFEEIIDNMSSKNFGSNQESSIDLLSNVMVKQKLIEELLEDIKKMLEN